MSSRNAKRARFGAFMALAALGAGCSSELTEIVLVVDSDLGVPDQLDRVRFEVYGPAGVTKTSMQELASPNDLPVTLGLVHESGPLAPLDIVVIGERAGSPSVRRRALLAFREGETLMLRMDLFARCVTVGCDDGFTCGEQGCRPIAVDDDELVPWTGVIPPLDRACAELDCNDGIACTDDRCQRGMCVNVPDDTKCTGGDICNVSDGCGGRPCDDNADCNDGNFCNGTETCVGGACVVGPLPDCDDGVPCTADRCDEAAGGCVHNPDTSACDDALDCTVDSCDPVLNCQFTPNDAACDDGIPCTVDMCVPGAGCTAAADDTRCDDGVDCTVDVCTETGCDATPVDALCDDGVGCTANVCDATMGCQFPAMSGACAPGELCEATGCVLGPTFTQIYDTIIRIECGPCHIGMERGGLDMGTQSLAFMELVGTTAVCGGGGNVRVIPGDARSSLLWRKVANVDLCGARMPMGGGLTTAQADLIADWINAGALDN